MSTATSFRIATPDLTNRWITPQGHAEASCHNCTTTVRASDEGWYHPGTGQARCPREAPVCGNCGRPVDNDHGRGAWVHASDISIDCYPETDPRRDLTVSVQDTAQTEAYR